MFSVPESSPPSTPEAPRQKLNFFNASNPSTTPVGPPPSLFSNHSTTPPHPPPSSVFGSGRFNAGGSFPSGATSSHNLFRSSPPHAPQDEYSDEYDEGEDEAGVDNDAMEEDAPVRSVQESENHKSRSALRDDQRRSEMSDIAKGFFGRVKKLDEPDSLIVQTEDICNRLHSSISSDIEDLDRVNTHLSLASQYLSESWASGQTSGTVEGVIGPRDNASGTAKANFLASLALALHHPPLKPSEPGRARASPLHRQLQSIPGALLHWLDANHDPFPNDYSEAMNTPGNVCAHPRFWDIVSCLQIRGRLGEVLQLLKHADFQQAQTAIQEGHAEPGYRGNQLTNTNHVVSRAIKTLEQCPAVQNGDWNVTGTDWAIFRSKVRQELTHLEVFSQGSDVTEGEIPFQASNFGMSSVQSGEHSLSQKSKRAESRVPWSIYQNLQYFYAQLLGTYSEIIAASYDWVVATIAITVWWDGEKDDSANENLAASRSSFRQSRQNAPRPVDVAPFSAYQEKLSSTLQRVDVESDELELKVNTARAVEVGLACVFCNDIEGVVGIMQGWSATISAAFVEIAGLGGWLNVMVLPSRSIMDRFDQSDLMVLSFAQEPSRGIKVDEVLSRYAALLTQRKSLTDEKRNRQAEGWELAIQVIGRLGNEQLADQELNHILDRVKLSTPERVEKVVDLCMSIGLVEQSRKTAERFADQLSESSNNYGDALLYYARARNPQRVKDVLNVLISTCLVQSAAYPAIEDLDPTLNAIISTPKKRLAQLAVTDRQAADLLSTKLSGYALVRKFYNLRDDDPGAKRAESSSVKTLSTRYKEAGSILTDTITSAADCIHGGLYDNSVESVVPVDSLLVLLGEALMFIDQSNLILSSSQTVALMKAVEDLTTAPSAIFSRCDQVFKSTVANAHGSSNLSTRDAMKKSSNLSASSSFSMVASRTSGGTTSQESSGVLVSREVKRGWDWRKGLNKGTGSADVLKILRLGLARDMARHWTE